MDLWGSDSVLGMKYTKYIKYEIHKYIILNLLSTILTLGQTNISVINTHLPIS